MSRQILMVIAPEDFRDEELLTPRRIFQEQGWHVDTASTRVGKAAGMLGAAEDIALSLEDVDDRLYDAVVVVGGMGSPTYLWRHSLLHDILRKHNENKRVVAAICLSGAVLANAGLLRGKSATVWECP